MSRAQPKTGWPAIHGGVLLVSLILVLVCLPAMKWPWYLLLPFAVYGCIVLLVPPLRRTTEWLSAGRLNGMGFLAAMVLSVLTAAVLIAYESLFHPNLTTLAASLPVASFNSIVWAGVCFSVVNAILEEFIFRGVFYGALAAEWGSAVAILVTALCFGLSHLHG